MEDSGGKNITVHITTGSVVKVFFFILLIYLLFQLRDLVLVILTSVVLAASVEPATKWFARYKIPRIPAVLAVYLAVVSLLVGVFSFFVPVILSEASEFLSSLPQYIDSISAWNPVGDGSLLEKGGAIANELNGFSLRDIVTSLRDLSTGAEGGFLQLMVSVFGGIFSFILIVILSFYLAVQEDGIQRFLELITPIKRRGYVVDLWKRTQVKIGLWMQGQLLLIVLIGVLTYLGLTILGVPYALLLGLFAGLAELIPIFGPVIAAIPAIMLAFVNGVSFVEAGLASAIAVGLFYVLIQQFENNLIYPLVVQKVVGVPPILVIIALIIGWDIAGFLGIILAVPIAAGLMELAHDVQKREKK